MATKLTINGVSTTQSGERYEKFKNGGRTFIQYDYRDVDNELFSTVQKTLQQCRVARDKWLNAKNIKKN